MQTRIIQWLSQRMVLVLRTAIAPPVWRGALQHNVSLSAVWDSPRISCALYLALTLGLFSTLVYAQQPDLKSGNGNVGHRVDAGTGTVLPSPKTLWHYFPDQDVANPAENINVLVLSNRHEGFAAQDLEAHTTGINFASLNVASYDPQPGDFVGYDAVLLFEDGLFDNTVDVGNAISTYQQAGGGVVLTTFVWQDWSNNTKYGPRPGWGNLEAVSPLISDTQGCEYNSDNLGSILLPDHPIMNGVNSLSADSYRGGTQLSPVGTAVALWSTFNFLGTNDPVVAIYEPASGGRTAAISVIPHYGNFGGFSGDYYQLFENALKWVAAQPVAACSACLIEAGLVVGTAQGDPTSSITIPVEVRSAPNTVDALGFDVTFDAAVLAFTGFTRGPLTTTWTQFEVTLPTAGRLRVGGFTSQDPIAAGTTGRLVELHFEVLACDVGQEAPLTAENLVDDVATWDTCVGCFTCAEVCDGDVNGDGQLTPGDALLDFQCFLQRSECTEEVRARATVHGDIHDRTHFFAK